MNKIDFISASKSDLSETPFLYYVDGYKYQSRNDMIYQVFIYPKEDIITDIIVLRKDGWLWVSKYFAWDGCSGPTWDDSKNMRGGHAHDALAALMRMGLLPMSHIYETNDVIKNLMIKDGASHFRARAYELALDHVPKTWANPKHARKIKIAPHIGQMPGLSPA